MIKTQYKLIGTFLFAGLLFLPNTAFPNENLNICKSIWGDKQTFSTKSVPFKHIKIYSQNKLQGYCVNTKDTSSKISGYGGHIEMLLAIDKNFKIKDVFILKHNETLDFVKNMDELVKQFRGKTYKDSLRIGKDIDAMTSATISSDAIAKEISETLKRLSLETLERPSMLENHNEKNIKSLKEKQRLKKFNIVPKEAKYWKEK